MFDDYIVTNGVQFRKSESQMWGLCNLPSDTATATASPTTAATTCEMSYELVLKAAAESPLLSPVAGAAFWDFVYGQH